MKRLLTWSVWLVLSVSAAAAEEPTAEAHLAFWRPLIGTWKMTTEVAGEEPLVATWTFSLSPTKACYFSFGSSEGLPAFQTIDGYDPKAKCWKAVGFDVEGGHRIRLIRCDMTKVDRVAQGATTTSEEEYTAADGQVTTSRTTGVCVEATPVRVVWKITERKQGNGPEEKPLPDMTVTCERIKQKPKKPSP